MKVKIKIEFTNLCLLKKKSILRNQNYEIKIRTEVIKARILMLLTLTLRRFWDLRLKVLFYNATISLGILEKKKDTTQYSIAFCLN